MISKEDEATKKVSYNRITETELHCEIGNHSWWRKKQRGRPPLNCPEHQPTEIKVSSIPFAKTHEYAGVDFSAKKSITDIVPGLKDLLQQDETETLHCIAGDHSWQRAKQRGKKPMSCPEHAVQGEKLRKVEKVQENKQIARERLETVIAGLSARVAAAIEPDDTTYAAFRQNPADENLFKQWMKYNSRLLNEVSSMRAQERKLEYI